VTGIAIRRSLENRITQRETSTGNSAPSAVISEPPVFDKLRMTPMSRRLVAVNRFHPPATMRASMCLRPVKLVRLLLTSPSLGRVGNECQRVSGVGDQQRFLGVSEIRDRRRSGIDRVCRADVWLSSDQIELVMNFWTDGRQQCNVVKWFASRTMVRGADPSAPVSVFGLRGGSPLQADALRPVSESNCVTARWGGKQLEENE